MLANTYLDFVYSALRIITGSSFSLSSMALLYLGPDSVIPLASVIAAVLGVILIFWRFILGSIKRGIKLIRRKISGDVEEELVLVDPESIAMSEQPEEETKI